MAGKRPSIPNAHRVVKRLSGGRVAIYWYHHRGGPLVHRFAGDTLEAAERLEIEGARDLMAAHVACVPAPREADTLGSLVRLFREVPEGLSRLAPSTRRQWTIWLDRIVKDLGDMPLKALGSRHACAALTEWRDGFADSPRSADYAIQVLRRVLAVAVRRGKLDRNPAEGIETLYKANRSDVIITEEELVSILREATPQARYAIRLAAATGWRRGDLIELRWDDIKGSAIQVDTNKSGGRILAACPLHGDGAAVIEELRALRNAKIEGGEVPSAYVLTTERGTPWKGDSLTQAFIRAADKAGVDKRLHDLRGTCATRWAKLGASDEDIALFIGWDPAKVRRIIHRYVSTGAKVQAAIERVEKSRAAS